jgi:hypothetical protein
VPVPDVRLDAPPEWTLDPTTEQPKLAESSGAEMVSYRVLRDPTKKHEEGHAVGGLVAGCVATPIPGWVDDMRPSIEGRTVALAGAATERLLGGDFPIDARQSGDGKTLVLRSAKDLDQGPAAPIVGSARTFVGFDSSSRVFTCFAACASRSGSGSGSGSGSQNPVVVGCEAAVAGSRLEGSSEPPTPGLALRSVTWAVHHPRPFALGAAIFITSLAVLAIVRRPRPRFRG